MRHPFQQLDEFVLAKRFAAVDLQCSDPVDFSEHRGPVGHQFEIGESLVVISHRQVIFVKKRKTRP